MRTTAEEDGGFALALALADVVEEQPLDDILNALVNVCASIICVNFPENHRAALVDRFYLFLGDAVEQGGDDVSQYH